MNYDEMLAQIGKIESWLVEAGHDPSRSRIARYKKDLATLADPKKRNNLLRHFTPVQLNELFFTFIEVSEISVILSTLVPQYEPLLKDRLLEIVTGPASSAAEKPMNAGNRPRNLQFELFLMAQLARSGFPIEETKLADVQTLFKGRALVFECKRPQALSGIHAVIKDGVAQLRKLRASGQSKPLLILAISLTKAMTEGRSLLRAPDSRTALEMLYARIHECIGPHMPYFHRQAESLVAGILVHSCVTTLPSDPPSISAVGAQVFFDNPQVSQDERALGEDWFAEYEKLEKLP